MINQQKWENRFAYGTISLFVVTAFGVLLLTKLGRALFAFCIIAVVLIMALGYVVELLQEAYETHIK